MRYALLAALALSACGSAKGQQFRGLDTNWTVSPAVMAEYGSELDEITEMWCTATEGDFCPDFVESPNDPDVIPADTSTLSEANREDAENQHAWFDPNTGKLSVRSGLPKECLPHILGHELAHSIPLWFTANTCQDATPAPDYGPDRIRDPYHCRGTIMDPGVNLSRPETCQHSIDSQTVAAFRDTVL